MFGSHNVVDTGHGVDVVLGVERAGDGASLAAVLSSTDILSTDSQPDSLPPASPGLGAVGGDDLQTDHVGVGVDKPGLVQSLLVANSEVLRLDAVLNYLEVAGVTGQVQGGDLSR